MGTENMPSKAENPVGAPSLPPSNMQTSAPDNFLAGKQAPGGRDELEKSYALRKREDSHLDVKYKLGAWLIFGIVLIAELIGAYFLVYEQGIFMGDALSRTANAYYVLFLEPQKLASIGFVWNPLPSLLQLPILAFSSIWKPLASSGLAGSLLTAIFAALNAALLFSYLRKAKLGRFFSGLISLCFAFNPFVFFYGLNGMSETIFFTTILVSVAALSRWIRFRDTGDLATVGVMLGFGLLCRYETFAYVVAVFVAVLIITLWMDDTYSPFKHKPSKMKRDYAIASETIALVPFLYVLAIWMFLNWSIMGDPLFFLTSEYSNSSQSELTSGLSINAIHNPFFYMLIEMAPFSILLVAILAVRLGTKRLFKLDTLILVGLSIAIVLFHAFMLGEGKSYGWLRFFSYPLIVSIAWLPYEFTQIKEAGKRVLCIVTVVALLGSALLMPVYFNDPEKASEEHYYLLSDKEDELSAQNKIAETINARYSDSVILMDSFMTSKVILSLDKPENIITTTHDNFDLAIIQPIHEDVEYILIPKPAGVGLLDAINHTYPDMYDHGTQWLELVEDFEGYRMYKVIGKNPDPEGALESFESPVNHE